MLVTSSTSFVLFTFLHILTIQNCPKLFGRPFDAKNQETILLQLILPLKKQTQTQNKNNLQIRIPWIVDCYVLG